MEGLEKQISWKVGDRGQLLQNQGKLHKILVKIRKKLRAILGQSISEVAQKFISK